MGFVEVVTLIPCSYNILRVGWGFFLFVSVLLCGCCFLLLLLFCFLPSSFLYAIRGWWPILEFYSFKINSKRMQRMGHLQPLSYKLVLHGTRVYREGKEGREGSVYTGWIKVAITPYLVVKLLVRISVVKEGIVKPYKQAVGVGGSIKLLLTGFLK